MDRKWEYCMLFGHWFKSRKSCTATKPLKFRMNRVMDKIPWKSQDFWRTLCFKIRRSKKTMLIIKLWGREWSFCCYIKKSPYIRHRVAIILYIQTHRDRDMYIIYIHIIYIYTHTLKHTQTNTQAYTYTHLHGSDLMRYFLKIRIVRTWQ